MPQNDKGIDPTCLGWDAWVVCALLALQCPAWSTLCMGDAAGVMLHFSGLECFLPADCELLGAEAVAALVIILSPVTNIGPGPWLVLKDCF